MGKKIRHQFLLDTGTSERLNALARGPGATKTDIIAEAIKAFFERGSDTELNQLSAQRLDRISRDLDAVRHGQENLRREVETVREALASFALFSFLLTARTSSPDKDDQAIGRKRFHNFIAHVTQLLASGTSSFAPKDKRDGA